MINGTVSVFLFEDCLGDSGLIVNSKVYYFGKIGYESNIFMLCKHLHLEIIRLYLYHS